MEEDKYYVLVKGASEIILERCSKTLTQDGSIVELDDEYKK